MNKIKENVLEIDDFISKLRFDSPLKSSSNIQLYMGCYKYIHSLLIWESLLESSSKSQVNEWALLYYKEMMSDISSSQALVLTGLYKPSRMMLRSSIENLIRLIALEQGFIISDKKFTHEIISLVKSSRLGAKGSPVAADIDFIVQSYAKLCAYTHASQPKFLALKIPLKSLNAFDRKEYADIIEMTRNIVLRFNRISFVIYNHVIGSAHRKHRDFILDALPKSLKAQMQN